MKLHALYAALQQAILGGDTQPALALIKMQPPLLPEQRLAVYRDGYHLRMRAAVADDYTCLAYVLGKDRFESLVAEYLHDIPSGFFNLDCYSIGFGPFAASRLQDRFGTEISLIESHINDVYLRTETPALLSESLMALPPDALSELQLPLRHACILMETQYGADDFLTAFREGQTPVRPQAEKEWLAIIRHQHVVRRIKLDHAEYRLLQTLAEGKPFGQACEQISREEPLGEQAFAEHLQGWFARWLTHGLLQDAAASASSSS